MGFRLATHCFRAVWAEWSTQQQNAHPQRYVPRSFKAPTHMLIL